MGSILGLGRFSGVENGNPLQYSCLENSMDIGAWWATVHGVTKESEHIHAHTPHTLEYGFNRQTLGRHKHSFLNNS